MFGAASAACLRKHLAQGLAITPISYLELAPSFHGDALLLEQFLAEVGVAHQREPGMVVGLEPAWEVTDTERAFTAWHRQILARRAHGNRTAKRPIADMLIATVACRFTGAITRNGTDFRAFYDSGTLRLVDPTDRSTWA